MHVSGRGTHGLERETGTSVIRVEVSVDYELRWGETRRVDETQGLDQHVPVVKATELLMQLDSVLQSEV